MKEEKDNPGLKPNGQSVVSLINNRTGYQLFPITCAEAVYARQYNTNLEEVISHCVTDDKVISDVDDLLATEEPGYVADASALSELLSGLEDVRLGLTEYLGQPGYIAGDNIVPFSGAVDYGALDHGDVAKIPLTAPESMYELYTYEQRQDTGAIRGTHAYLIATPTSSRTDNVEIVPMAISANSGVVVGAERIVEEHTDHDPTGKSEDITYTTNIPGISIKPSSTAYNVKYVLRRIYGDDSGFYGSWK